MAKSIVSDALWDRLEPLLPPPKPRRFRYPGRKPLDRRKVFTGIVFVLKTGIVWEALPAELGYGCGMTCLNYLKELQAAGVWDNLHYLLLDELQGADKIDWSRSTLDSSHARSLGGGENSGKNPTDRGKLGTKHHVLTDAQGIPLAVNATGSNQADVNEALPLIDSVPPITGKPGRPRKRPEEIYMDRAYDSERLRQELRRRGIIPKIPKRNTEHGSGLGIYRWVAERTVSWLHSFRRLRLRTDRNGPVHNAFIALASSLICMWFL